MDAPRNEVAELAKAVRFGLVMIVLCVSYLDIRMALGIEGFAKIFEDMLGQGTQLPWMTRMVLEYQFITRAVSFAIPIAALALLAMRNRTRAIYIAGVLLVAAFMQWITLCTALTGPLVAIIQNMTAKQ